MKAAGLRERLGVLVLERPRYRRALAAPGDGYLSLCNRREKLEPAPDGAPGFRCLWPWTSDLHAPRVCPDLGVQLMQRALDDHPVVRAAAPPAATGEPEITFLIGHRGMGRLPHLLATLEAIAGQEDARVECIVIEQDGEALARPHLPAWVRHIHTPPPQGLPYCRAWAFNVGARHARSPVLVLQDNDMLLPADYSACVLRHVREGRELVNLKRFIFYLDRQASAEAIRAGAAVRACAAEAITQNLEGGGSVAITREAYGRIGGLDESFIGWGGEDNEFWERGQTLGVWPWAYLPIVHLWHEPQPGKQAAANPTLSHYRRLSAIPAAERIARLRQRSSGRMDGPAGAEGGG